MNKEEKLAYLDKLVEPQGNESGMSVAPLLREMIEDAGDQVEVDDAIEAAKEAKETAEAAEAAATAAGTAAQGAATAAKNAQRTADEALQAAQNAGVGKPGTGTNSEIFNDYENNEASEDYSHSEGSYTHAVGICSHAEGNLTRASDCAHAEGYNSNASGGVSHAEGHSCIASGDRSHSEGYTTVASGDNSHAEGTHTTASGENSHAEGSGSRASGVNSHSEGYNAVASGDNSHAEGALNVDLNGTENKFKMRHMVGIGDTTGNLTRKNAHTIMTNGDHYVIGVGGYQGTERTEEAFDNIKTLQDVINETVATAGAASEAASAAQTAAQKAQQTANDAKQAAADSYVTGSPFSISAQSTSEQVNEFLGGFDNIAQAIDDGKKIYYHYTPRYSTDETQSTLPYLATAHGREDDNTVRLCYVVREFYFYQIKITKQDDGTLVCLKSETEFSTTFPDDVPQDATSHNLVGIPAGTDVTQDIIYLYDSIDNFIRLMNGKVPIYVSIGGGDYGNYQTLVGHINPGNVYEEGDEMVFIHYKSDKTSPIFDRIQGLKIDREAGTVTAVDCPQPSNVQLSDTSPSSDASTASAGTSKTAARADHVHPFAAGDIQNPKSMQGVDLDTILEPGYYEGVPAAKEGNPTVSDFASMVVMRGNGADSLCQIIYADGEKALSRVKPNASNSWADWKPLSETDLTGTAVKPNTFASGDLDTLTQTGMYVLTSNILSDYTNFPPVPTGYTPYYPVLYVYNSGGVVSQTISVNHGDNKLYSYSRNNQPGAFGDWAGGAVGGADQAVISELQTAVKTLQEQIAALQEQIAALQGTGA